MFFHTFVAVFLLVASTSAFWTNTVNTALQGIRRAECQLLAKSRSNEQYKRYCKVGRVSVIGLDVGGGLRGIPSNQLRYSGPVLRTSDITFMTEQDGYGTIIAKFNGAILKCKGFSGMKRKTCVIPRSLRPWSGRITVEVSGPSGGYRPSTSYYMGGTPICANAGFEGDNCNTDIDECVRHKDKRLCAWAKGCVNTIGSYKCTCPPGYKVSHKDFRLCAPDVPKITSPPTKVTVMYGSSVTLSCQHQASGPVTVAWQLGNKVIAFQQTNGATQTVLSRLTLQNDGDLVVSQITYGDAGQFVCVVKSGQFVTYVTHTLQVESAPLFDFQHLVSGNYTSQHAYKVGDKLTIDCQVLSMPKSVITIQKDGKVLQSTPHLKLTNSKIADMPIDIDGALQVRLQITSVQISDAGTITCTAINKHGSRSKAIILSVTK